MILLCAIQNEIKNLILGAYDCDAFHNKPENIANSFKHLLLDVNLKDYFETISLSIIERIDKILILSINTIIYNAKNL